MSLVLTYFSVTCFLAPAVFGGELKENLLLIFLLYFPFMGMLEMMWYSQNFAQTKDQSPLFFLAQVNTQHSTQVPSISATARDLSLVVSEEGRCFTTCTTSGLAKKQSIDKHPTTEEYDWFNLMFFNSSELIFHLWNLKHGSKSRLGSSKKLIKLRLLESASKQLFFHH